MILVRGKTILTTEDERKIAAAGEQNASIHTFSIDRVQSDGVDLSALSFHMDVRFSDGNKDTVILEKTVKTDNIELSYTVTGAISSHPGSCLCSLRGTDDSGNVKWRSFPAAFYVEDTAVGDTGGFNLSELEQLELKFRKNIKELNDAEATRVQQEQERASKETERVNAENGRVRAENVRQEKLQEIIRQKEVLDGYQGKLEATERGIVERLQQISSESEQITETNAIMAKSYAVGGTGKRPGEISDNAKYYLSQAERGFNDSKTNLNKASEAVDNAIKIVNNARNTLNQIENVRFDDSETNRINNFNDGMNEFVAGKSLGILFANLKKMLEYVLKKESIVDNFGDDTDKAVSVRKFTEQWEWLSDRSNIMRKRIKGTTNENGHIKIDLPRTKALISIMKCAGNYMVLPYAPDGYDTWWCRVKDPFENVLKNTYVEFDAVYFDKWEFV